MSRRMKPLEPLTAAEEREADRIIREHLELHVPEPEPPRRSGCSIFGWLALILVWVLW